jgi:hypothetical protein
LRGIIENLLILAEEMIHAPARSEDLL